MSTKGLGVAGCNLGVEAPQLLQHSLHNRTGNCSRPYKKEQQQQQQQQEPHPP